jgi:hypothetical protein
MTQTALMIFPSNYSTSGRNGNLLTLIGEARDGTSLTLRLTRQYRSRWELYRLAVRVGGILELVAAVERGSDQARGEAQAELAAVSTCMVVMQQLMEQADEVVSITYQLISLIQRTVRF